MKLWILTALAFFGILGFSQFPGSPLALKLAVISCWILVFCLIGLFLRLLRYFRAPTEDEDADADQSSTAILRILNRIHKR